jgi:hypothetical protein
MEAGSRGLRVEAQNVTVRDVVGDGKEVAVERLHVFELEVLPTGEVRDGIGDIAAQGVARGNLGEMSEAQRRNELLCAIEVL